MATSTRLAPLPETAPQRLTSLDAFRGLVMFLMLAEALHLPALPRMFPDNALASFIAFHTSHVAWRGCSLHDLIQPGFSLLVGAALPFSIASRRRKGQALGQMLRHAALRALILIALGIALRAIGRSQINFTFEDTLTQIGLGYLPLFLLGFTTVRWQIAALAGILLGYWALFALYPAPGPDFNYAAVGVPPDWSHHYSGFASHWNKNSNAAWAFDTWFLNLFPREQPFVANRGGYATLSFIPTLGTMIIGLLAGQWLRGSGEASTKRNGLIVSGLVLIAVALLWEATGTCPIVKRIWTPSFTLYSGGWVLLFIGAFYHLCDLLGRKRWAFPLLVLGMNSIAAYLASWVLEPYLGRMLSVFVGPEMLRGALLLGIISLILYFMHRRNIYLRI